MERVLSWRQGNVVKPEAIKTIELAYPLFDSLAQECFWVVISHDCDLTAEETKEPYAEICQAKRIPKLGSDSYGKTTRRLHIEYDSENGPVVLELYATYKAFVKKAELFRTLPYEGMWLTSANLNILQCWLAARYRRAAFPEAFETRLRDARAASKKTFLKRIETILEKSGKYVRSLMFDVDEGKDIERQGSADLYRLGINVLYDSENNEDAASEMAKTAAVDLESLFVSEFYSEDGGWNNIQLTYCEPKRPCAPKS